METVTPQEGKKFQMTKKILGLIAIGCKLFYKRRK
jgi:hypothetical protein